MLRRQVGLFSPIFVIGGLMGRIFGEMARWMNQYVASVQINFQVRSTEFPECRLFWVYNRVVESMTVCVMSCV